MRISCFLLILFLPLLLSGQGRQQYYIDSLLTELSNKQNDTAKIKLLEDISYEYSKFNYEEGIKYGNKAVTLSEELNLPKWIASTTSVLAMNYEAKNDFEKAIKLNEKALEIFSKLNRKRNIAAINANLSMIYLNLGNFTKALDASFEALKIYEEYKNNKNIAIVLENIGHVYFGQKNYEKSEEYYSKALKIFESTGNQAHIARCMGNIARVFQANENFEKALGYLFESLKTNEELQLNNSIQINLANIGNIYTKTKNFPKAVKYLKRALKISQELNSKKSIAVNYGNLGNVYLGMAKDNDETKIESNLTTAIDYLEKAVKMCKEIGLKAPQIDFSQGLSEAYELSQNYKSAYNILKSKTLLEDSIFSNQSKIEISNLETEREITLKNKDIIIKNKELEITKLKATNDRILYLSGILLLFIVIFILIRFFIKRTESHKNEMANMIHIQSHDIRGPIASILGLTQLLNHNEAGDIDNKELIEGIHTLATDLDEVLTKVIKNKGLN